MIFMIIIVIYDIHDRHLWSFQYNHCMISFSRLISSFAGSGKTGIVSAVTFPSKVQQSDLYRRICPLKQSPRCVPSAPKSTWFCLHLLLPNVNYCIDFLGYQFDNLQTLWFQLQPRRLGLHQVGGLYQNVFFRYLVDISNIVWFTI